MANEKRAPTEAEMARMKALLREGLEAGALGLSYGLIYVPGCYATTDECVELARVVAEYNGILAAHIRNEGDTLLEAVEEFLEIIRRSGCRGVFSHHKAAAKWNWGKVKKSLAMIDAAVAEGADVYVDAYPYVASGTSLAASFLPKQFHYEGMRDSLQLLAGGERENEIRRWAKGRWNNDYSWVLPYRIPRHDEYAGLNINEIADLRGQADRLDTIYDLIRETKKEQGACFFTMSEDDVAYVLAHPRVMIGTDSAVACGKSLFHPRLRGTFPRVLGRYVR
jgi:N-acyl-D-aspartate/D-glutamate deacylase